MLGFLLSHELCLSIRLRNFEAKKCAINVHHVETFCEAHVETSFGQGHTQWSNLKTNSLNIV